MKKSLLALAVLSAFASAAQAQVTLGGTIAINIKDYKIGNTTRTVENELRIDDDYTSRFWLSGTEDLGGGNAALFYIENRFNTDVGSTGTGNGLSNGETFVGLKGAWGQMTAGRHSLMSSQGLATEYLTGGGGASTLPASFWGTYSILNSSNGTALDTTRRNNSIVYRLPSNLGGFNGTLAYSTNSSGTEGTINGTSYYSNGGEYYMQAGYSNGPVYTSLAYRNFQLEGRGANPTTGAPAAGNDAKQVRLTGYYKFSFGLKAGLTIDRSYLIPVVSNVTGSAIKRSAWELPVSYAFGSNTLFANFTKAGDLSTAAHTGAKMFVFGYDYSLSKRTDVGVYYFKLKNDTAGTYQPFNSGTTGTGSPLLAGESASTLAFGIKHTF
ncbi:MAG TPA: porin [Burkholderiaceae bacterium]|jgi:predicted porin